jgi:hypothetical protein
MNLGSAELKVVNCKLATEKLQIHLTVQQPVNLNLSTLHRNAQPLPLKISSPNMHRTLRVTKVHLHNMTRRHPEPQRQRNLKTRSIPR